MHKLNIYAAIGKGRPIHVPSIRSRVSASHLHNSSTIKAEDEGKGRELATPIRHVATRADRLKAASSEVQSLFESSSTRSDSGNSRGPSAPTSSSAVTASESLKERLRQRAAQRTGQTGTLNIESSRSRNVQRAPPRGLVRRAGPSRTPMRGGGSATSRSNPRPERRKKTSRSFGSRESKDHEYVGHEYNDPYPDTKNVALLEKALYIQKERAEKKLPVPTQYSEMSEEEQDLEDLMKTRAVKPDPASTLALPTGVHNEPLGSGLGSQEHVDRLMAMAKAKSNRQWAGVRLGEGQDVDALANAFKAQRGTEDSSIDENGATKAILGKWLEGQYQPIQQDDSNAINNALRGVSINKSYTPQDGSAFMEHFKKIVASPGARSKGKVREAVEAGAREAAMSKDKEISGSKVV